MAATNSLYDIPVKTIKGEDSSLGAYKGKVVLVVNVASKCGLTKQYEGLEKIYEQLSGEGFVIAGFPSNDFEGQEPGSNEEIQAFCTGNFGVKFPLLAKITVAGAGKHPLYAALTTAPVKVEGTADQFRAKLEGFGIKPNPAPEVLWNFEKFLLGRNGQVVKRFSPDTLPDDPALVGAIKAELGKSA